MDRLHEGVEAAFPVRAIGRAGVVLEKVTEKLQVRESLADIWWPSAVLQLTADPPPPLLTLQFAVDGLRTVSSGLLGLGLGDSQELKKDWMKGSRFCPFWKP